MVLCASVVVIAHVRDCFVPYSGCRVFLMCVSVGLLDGDLREPSEMPLFSLVFASVDIDTGKGV